MLTFVRDTRRLRPITGYLNDNSIAALPREREKIPEQGIFSF